MRDKKGSMELGINAIVILIIALVLLGLGIGFITRLFTQSSDTFGDIIKNTELEFHADAMNPIKFETTEATVKKGSTTAIKVSVYNSGVFAENAPLSLSITECIDANGILYINECNPLFTSGESTPAGCGDSYNPTPDSIYCTCHLGVVKLAAPSQAIAPGTDGGYRAILSVPKTFYGGLTDAQMTNWLIDERTGASDGQGGVVPTFLEMEKVRAQTYICTVKATDNTVDNPMSVTSQLYVKVIV